MKKRLREKQFKKLSKSEKVKPVLNVNLKNASRNCHVNIYISNKFEVDVATLDRKKIYIFNEIQKRALSVSKLERSKYTHFAIIEDGGPMTMTVYVSDDDKSFYTIR